MSKFNIGNCSINVQRLSLNPCSLDEYELQGMEQRFSKLDINDSESRISLRDKLLTIK